MNTHTHTHTHTQTHTHTKASQRKRKPDKNLQVFFIAHGIKTQDTLRKCFLKAYSL
jgi:hypothetical protein